jgi:hypothetical protein
VTGQADVVQRLAGQVRQALPTADLAAYIRPSGNGRLPCPAQQPGGQAAAPSRIGVLWLGADLLPPPAECA